jgi:O-antigen/teichoic acid export membrane protein
MSLNNVFNLWYARKFAKFSWNNLNIRRHLRKLPVFLVITAVSTVYTGLDKTLLGLACGNEALGLYTPAERIVRLVILGIVSLSAVFVPRLADLFATNTAEFWRLAKKSFNFLALLAVPAFVCLLVFAPFVIEVLAGDKYAGSVPLLRILSVVVLLVVGANVFGIQMLVLMGSEKKYLFSVVVSMVFGATVFYLAVPRLGGTGTSIGVVVAESVGLAIQLWFCRASLGRLFDPRFLCKVAAAVALSLVPSLVIMALAGSGKGLWGVAEVGVFWLSFGALLFAFKFEQVAFVKGFFQKREER